jgi:hypothetical protein
MAEPAKSRFQKLPWDYLERSFDSKEWRDLDAIRHHLFRFAGISLWHDGRPAASPIWLVGRHRARLNHLQFISRLPRAEVLPAGQTAHLFFRFSGGAGILAHNSRLREPSFLVFQPQPQDLFSR